MKSAKEMFEELGYEIITNDYLIITYRKNCDIDFYKGSKAYGKWFNGNGEPILPIEHQAIHQQMKELNWLEQD
jgi:hypothetical protein